jgi:hypothetical protein
MTRARLLFCIALTLAVASTAIAEGTPFKEPFLRLSYRAYETGAGLDDFFNGSGNPPDDDHWSYAFSQALSNYEQTLDANALTDYYALNHGAGSGGMGTGPVITSCPWGAQAQVQVLGELVGLGVMAAGRTYDCPVYCDMETDSQRVILTYERNDVDVTPYVSVSFPWNRFGAMGDVSTGRVVSFAGKFAIRGNSADHFVSIMAELLLGATFSFSRYQVIPGEATEYYEFFSRPLLAADELLADAFHVTPWFSITLLEYMYRPNWCPAALRVALNWDMRGNLWNEADGVEDHNDTDFFGAMRQTLVLSAGLAL